MLNVYAKHNENVSAFRRGFGQSLEPLFFAKVGQPYPLKVYVQACVIYNSKHSNCSYKVIATKLKNIFYSMQKKINIKF